MNNTPTLALYLTRALVNGATTNGGATIDSTGNVPRSGFCVGRGGAEALNPKRSYMDQALEIVEAELNNNPRTSFGAWVDSETQRLYIEPVDIFRFRADALQAARLRAEIAIYDLELSQEIRVKYDA